MVNISILSMVIIDINAINNGLNGYILWDLTIFSLFHGN
jgi:hypothetical protein